MKSEFSISVYFNKPETRIIKVIYLGDDFYKASEAKLIVKALQ